MSRELTPREKMILNCIVQEFIMTATPVGSRYLVKKYNLNISPATVRNVMADLEDLGYLWHPHASAGRIPTDKGYRFYVDNLLEVKDLSPDEKEVIKNVVKDKSELEEILRHISKLIGKISKQLSIASTPQINDAILTKLDIVSISETRLLVVITLQSGLVRTIILEVSSEVSRDKLDFVKTILNERLSGLTLKQVRETFVERVRDVEQDYRGIINVFIRSAERLFYDFYDIDKIHIGGVPDILEHPEFSDPEKVRDIMELVENEDKIIQIFQVLKMQSGGKFYTDKVVVSIGEENMEDRLKDYTLIASEYKAGGVSGVIGLIGPKRMNYSRMISLVNYTRDVLSEVLH
ncbi:heat-inducible transcriptional repressor HrcA [Candidatus Kryptobacter tengchongensis]|uniref:heat-inducible transcriptional repressor HrcA n=2 Tax=Kryptobacter tengchongensis TaxID=1643429 RepID=UPI000707C801|nr:heat-inducible transcriptional repressor HrcA [Candidatus Kryptobacter tengchongensis]CUS79761.1 heat-inducible transcription repressor HrcA [Candidatus Kryptobacter tengchongensis]